MKRAMIFGGAVVAVAILLAVGPGLLDDAVNGEHKPPCDLLAGPCTWSTEDGIWQVTLTPGGDSDQGQLYQLDVVVPQAPDRFLAVLRGENMYMGEYPVPLVREEPLEYRATFTAPFCTTGNQMVWRIDLQDGQSLIKSVPSVLVFQADK